MQNHFNTIVTCSFRNQKNIKFKVCLRISLIFKIRVKYIIVIFEYKAWIDNEKNT
jgi:hypothetical protein